MGLSGGDELEFIFWLTYSVLLEGFGNTEEVTLWLKLEDVWIGGNIFDWGISPLVDAFIFCGFGATGGGIFTATERPSSLKGSGYPGILKHFI